MKTKRVLKKIAALSVGVAMLGATLTGALALDYSLADYPKPFITNGVFSGVMTVGKNAAASDTIGQSILLADLQTKAVTPVGSVSTINIVGEDEEISLGNRLNDDGKFDSGELDYNDLDVLQKKEIGWEGEDYKIHDEIVFTDDISVETSLTSDVKYVTDVALEANKRSIIYKYIFDNNIDFSDIDNPIKINFLGKKLEIIDVDNKKLVVNFGNQYVLEDGDMVDVDGKTVEIVTIGQNAITIDVDGIRSIIKNNAFKTVNGVEIELTSIVYTGDPKVKNSVELYVGEDVKQTIRDGDEYFNNEDWVWNLDKVDKDNDKHELWIELDKSYNSNDDDGIVKVGDCYSLPENFVKICLTELTNDDYNTYELEFDASYDLSDAEGYEDTSANVFVLKNGDEGIIVEGYKTDELILYVNDTYLDIFYIDDDNDVTLAISLVENTTHNNFAKIVNDDTSLNLDLNLSGGLLSTITTMEFAINENGNDINIILGKDTTEFQYLGTDGDAESSELKYNSKEIGTKSNDLRTRYGIIIQNPDSNGDRNSVILEVPSDQVKAVVEVGVTETEITGEIEYSEAVVVNPIPSSAVALSEEVTSPEAQNVIVIGGPAVNPLAESIFGLTVADFTPNEAIIKLADNGANVALLIAGYSAVDTRNAAEAIVAGKLAGLNKAEAKVTSANQIVGNYVVE